MISDKSFKQIKKKKKNTKVSKEKHINTLMFWLLLLNKKINKKIKEEENIPGPMHAIYNFDSFDQHHYQHAPNS